MAADAKSPPINTTNDRNQIHVSNALSFRLSKLAQICILVSLLSIFLIFRSFRNVLPSDRSQCEMAYMSPTYIKLDGFGPEQSRLGAKYETWLYREYGWDLSEKPNGIPVIFVPGNAGSFRQVRSLASAASKQYYESPGRPRKDLYNAGIRNLDFFAVNFNEDFSALHSVTLREQAEYLADSVNYVLSLYHALGKPTSVIIVAHSMGGIAARAMLLQPRYTAGSVHTLVTLSTPHIVPPATFDMGIEKLYGQINAYWRDPQAKEPRNIAFISLAGGTADTMVVSDTANTDSLISPDEGFSAFTTSLPALYSPVDHDAMMWCDQLRQAIVRGLLHTVNITDLSGVKSLSQRVQGFRRNLLANMLDEHGPSAPQLSKIDQVIELFKPVNTLRLQSIREHAGSMLNFELSPDTTNFHLVTDSKLQIEVLVCTHQENGMKKCRSLDSYKSVLPTSTAASAQTPNALLPSRLQYYNIPQDLLPSSSSSIGVRIDDKATKGMVLAGFGDANSSAAVDYISAVGLLFSSYEVLVPSQQIMAEWRFPNLGSSLLVYKVKLIAHTDSADQLLAPILRTYSFPFHESRYFSNFREALIHLHSTSPYMPGMSGSDTRGINLQLWSDKCTNCRIKIDIDIFASLGRLFLRYRMVFVAWPSALVLLVLWQQITSYHTHNVYTPFNIGFTVGAKRIGATLLSLSTIFTLLQIILIRSTGQDWSIDTLLGNIDPVYLWLPSLFLVTASGITLVLASILQLGFTVAARIARLSKVIGIGYFSRPSTPERGKQHLISALALVLAILLFAPYEFAVLVVIMLHWCATVGALIKAQDCSTSPSAIATAAWNRYHYYFTLSMLMVCALPANAAILFVWVRNLLVGWWAPFSTDHNVFAGIGFLLWAEFMHSDRVLEQPNSFIIKKTTALLPFCAGIYSLLYGIRYTYGIFTWLNIIMAWLAILQMDGIELFGKRRSSQSVASQ